MDHFFQLPALQANDLVELIAPSSRCSDSELVQLKELLESWHLRCLIKDSIFGDDLLCANTDKMRFQHVQSALLNPDTKAIICARGGYGSMRIIESLQKLKPSSNPKIILGMSDVTCLKLYLNKYWKWPTIHGAIAPSRFSLESIAMTKALMFAEQKSIAFLQMNPLNKHATEHKVLNAPVTGGNLTMIQASVGSCWQMNARNKIVVLEEVGERAYRVDRMLEHLLQAKMFDSAAAILFADFINGLEPNGSSLIQPVLERFAASCPIPVVQMSGVGHAALNYPLPFETLATLYLGSQIKLVCDNPIQKSN